MTDRCLEDLDKVGRDEGLLSNNANRLGFQRSKWSYMLDQIGWDDVLMKIRFHGICQSTCWGVRQQF
jgi:hypothetical protein